MRKWLKSIVQEALAEAYQALEAKSPGVEYFTRMTADEVVRYGKALDELAQGENYKYLVELVKRRRAQVGEQALQGGPGIEYWKGFRAGAESLDILVDPLRKHAQTLIEEHKDGGASMREFLGVSDGPLT